MPFNPNAGAMPAGPMPKEPPAPGKKWTNSNGRWIQVTDNGSTPLTTRLKGAATGAITGAMLGGGVPGAIAGGGAGFVAPKLTGAQGGGGFFGATEGGSAGGGDGGGNSMADVRARIEELRRQQYKQRTANLDQVMGFFGPVNAELKSIYGVDMPTFSPFAKGGGGPGLVPPMERNATLKPQFADQLLRPDANGVIHNPGAMPAGPAPSPFTKAPLKPGITPSRLRNPKSLPPGVSDPYADVPGTGQPWKRRYG